MIGLEIRGFQRMIYEQANSGGGSDGDHNQNQYTDAGQHTTTEPPHPVSDDGPVGPFSPGDDTSGNTRDTAD